MKTLMCMFFAIGSVSANAHPGQHFDTTNAATLALAFLMVGVLLVTVWSTTSIKKLPNEDRKKDSGPTENLTASASQHESASK